MDPILHTFLEVEFYTKGYTVKAPLVEILTGTILGWHVTHLGD